MKKVVKFYWILIVLLTVIPTVEIEAGVPLTNLQGVGGAAFNPFAYPANRKSSRDSESSNTIFSRPQIGAWYVNLGDVDVDWTSVGIAQTFFERLEISYSHEIISSRAGDIAKDNVGAKFLLIEENAWGSSWIPAISGGVIFKHTSPVGAGIDDNGFDYYFVATKMITRLPKPVLVSGGILSTDSRVTGVFGYDNGRDEVFFWNVDVLPIKNVAVGFEYKQGARFSGFKNANYYDIHAAWFLNDNLTLLGAYVNTGNANSSSRVGVGDGFVLSIQYAF